MQRVSTAGYYVIEQCLIGFITERGESWCSERAHTQHKNNLKIEHTNNTKNTTQKAALVNSTTDTLSKKPKLRDRTDRSLVAFYDIRPGNGAGLFLQPRRPRGTRQALQTGLVVWHCTASTAHECTDARDHNSTMTMRDYLPRRLQGQRFSGSSKC